MNPKIQKMDPSNVQPNSLLKKIKKEIRYYSNSQKKDAVRKEQKDEMEVHDQNDSSLEEPENDQNQSNHEFFNRTGEFS